MKFLNPRTRGRMRYPLHKFQVLMLAFCMTVMPMASPYGAAQSSGSSTTTARSKHAGKGTTAKSHSIASQIREMRQQFQQQQEEIDQLKQQLQSRDQQLQQAQDAAQQAQQTAVHAQTQAQSATQSSSQNNAAYTSLQQAVQSVQADTAQGKSDIVAVRT